MNLEALMREYAEEAGHKPFVADGNGAFNLEIDSMSVSFEETDDGHIVLQGPVGGLPPAVSAGRERLYRALLEAMFRGKASGGAVFSVDHASDTVYLHRIEHSLALDYIGFKAFVESFINVLAQWRTLLADYRPDAGQAEQGAQEEPEASHGSVFGGDGFIRV